MSCKQYNFSSVVLIFISLLVFFQGCTRHGLIGELPVVNNDFAEVIIVWPETKGNTPPVHAIMFDGMPIIGLKEGEYTIIRIPKGEHSFGMKCCPKFDVGLDYEAGAKYYYKVKVGPVNYALVPVSKNESIPLLKRSKYLPVDNNIVLGEKK